MTSAPTLQTERLILRSFVPGDAEMLWQIVTRDPAVMAPLFETPTTEAGERAIADRYINSYTAPWSAEGYGGWAVCASGDDIAVPGTLLGFCGFERPDLAGEGAEFGYGYGQDWWGRGIGLEAATVAIRWYFAEAGHDRVHACIAPDNHGSRKILEKIGLVQTREEDLWQSVEKGYGLLPVLTSDRDTWLRTRKG